MNLLSDCAKGFSGVVQKMEQDHPACQRLRLMGIHEGQPVQVVETAPAGDPLALELDGWKVCLRRRDASAIWVEAV